MSSRVQNLLILLGIVLIAALGYYLYTQSGATTLSPSTTNNMVAVESSLFLQRLNELNSISLESSVFADPYFQSLVDFSEPVSPQPVGRTNPFETN